MSKLLAKSYIIFNVLFVLTACNSSVQLASAQLASPVLSAQTASSSSIKLTWSDPNSSKLGYLVERSSSGRRGFSEIIKTDSNVTAFTDSSLSASTTYYYRVRAYAGKGKGKGKGKKRIEYSAYSGVVSATTSSSTSISDTTKPSATLTSPATGSIVSAGSAISLSASASDNVAVTKVIFYVNGTAFTDTTAPYAHSATMPTGTNIPVKARAYDAAGLYTDSAIHYVSNPAIDTTKPSVTLTSPATGSIISAGSAISLSASASDNVAVTKVIFYVNGTAFTDTTAPYAHSATMPTGTNIPVKARAYDAAGLYTDSAIHYVSNPAPTPTSELVKNGSFESGLTNWEDWGPSFITQSGVYDGTQALQSGTGGGGRSQIITNITSPAGKTYKLQAAGRVTSTDTTGLVVIRYLQAGVNKGNTELQFTETSFQLRSISVTIPSGIDQLQVYAYKGASTGYFITDQISLKEVQAPSSPTTTGLLFKSGFEGTTKLSGYTYCPGTTRDCNRNISGTDSVSGFTWPPKVWNSSSGTFLQTIAPYIVDSTTSPEHNYNAIQTVTDRNGNPTQAFYSELGGAPYASNSSPQNEYVVVPESNSIDEQGDLYIREWVKYQSDLDSKLVSGQTPYGQHGNWKVVFEFKTGGINPNWGGDYRFIVSIKKDSSGKLVWAARTDTDANGGLPIKAYWDAINATVPVPTGKWFKLEIFWHRSSGADGRYWVAVDGQTIFNVYGPNIGEYSLPINRIFLTVNYTGGYLPQYEWRDDIEIWDGFPADASPH